MIHKTSKSYSLFRFRKTCEKNKEQPGCQFLFPKEVKIFGQIQNLSPQGFELVGQGESVWVNMGTDVSSQFVVGETVCVCFQGLEGVRFHWEGLDKAQSIRVEKTENTGISNSLRSQHSSLQKSHCPRHLVLQRSWDLQKKWHHFLEIVRESLAEMGLAPVVTPTLVPCPGMEPNLEVFSVYACDDLRQDPSGLDVAQQGSRQEVLGVGQHKKRLFLPTSPELHMKKLLCRGATDIYEIRSCFRKEWESSHHLQEFTLLEWYRAYGDLDDIYEDTLQLIGLVQKKLFCGERMSSQPFEKVESLEKAKNLEISEGKVIKSTIAQLFKRHCAMELTPQTSREELFNVAKLNGLLFNQSTENLLSAGDSSQEGYSWDDLFHWLMLSLVEPHFNKCDLNFVFYYPPSQSALATINSEGWADRFELYWGGLEIANAFNELTDPEEQEVRFYRDIEEIKKLRGEVRPIDFDFLDHLKMGMPPSGGIALGLERLFMAMYSIEDIHDLRLF